MRIMLACNAVAPGVFVPRQCGQPQDFCGVCGCVLKEKPSPKGEGGAERRMRGKFAIIAHK